MIASDIVRDDRVLFKKWLRHPLKVGAVVASSRALARAMAAEVDLGRPGAVVELGGGTGAVTRALIARGVPPRDLVIIERDETFHRLLAERFPGARVIKGDATRLKTLLRRSGVGKVKAIVSGLPLRAMPPRQQSLILRQALDILGPEGAFVQFTYGPTPPVSERRLERLGAKARLRDLVWWNMPPATVWRFAATRAPVRRGPGVRLPERLAAISSLRFRLRPILRRRASRRGIAEHRPPA